MQHSVPFYKLARTNHRNDFECLAILLHLEPVYCENSYLDKNVTEMFPVSLISI